MSDDPRHDVTWGLVVAGGGEADREPWREALAASGCRMTVRRVEGLEGVRAALEQGDGEVVLADVDAPGLVLPEVLGELRRRFPDVPLVLLGNRAGEEAALELLKQGVWDLVLKDRLDRLGPVLERARREARGRRERRAAEVRVRESAALYHSLVEQLPHAVFRLDWEGRITFANRRYCEVIGRPLEELLGRTDRELFPPELAEKYWADSRRVMEAGVVHEAVERHVDREGRTGWVQVVKSPQRDAEGGIVGAQCLFWDVTARHLAEEALLASEARLRSLGDNLPGGALYQLLSPAGGGNRYTHVGAGIERLFGIPVAAILEDPKPFWALIVEEDRPRLAALQERSARELTPFECEFRQRAVDGQVRWVVARSVPRRMAEGATVWDGVVLDITDRKRAELQHELLATAIGQAAEAVVITDAGGVIEYVNPAFEKITGYTRAEAIGQTPRVLKSGRHDPEFYRRMWSTLTQGQSWSGRFTNRRKDGSLFEEEATISPVRDPSGRIAHFVGVKRDITREVELEAQFRQAQKMEAIGQLAGGVAHDFNNLLAVILMQAELGELGTKLPKPAATALGEVKRAAGKAASLTRQLLLFSRSQIMQSRVLDLNEVVSGIYRMLQRIVGEDIRLRRKLEAGPLWTYADSGMLDQVLLNLSVNARDAMPEGGSLSIETATRVVAPDEPCPGPGVGPGRYVGMIVADTGCGIPPEVMPRIFEPFYTTKEPGRGTGLGLATVFGIVQQHQGWIEVESRPEQGTTFRIYLPASDQAGAAPDPERKQAPPRGSETILVVEDDPDVRMAVRMVLARHGYRVFDADRARDALEILDRLGGDVQLILTDLVLPEGMNGRDLAVRAQSDHPEIQVVFMSGYSPELAGRQLELGPGQAFLSKPVTAELILETVARCLAR
jgi:two-component system cell cycle sensor histidine kinase/response regulator CckA